MRAVSVIRCIELLFNIMNRENNVLKYKRMRAVSVIRCIELLFNIMNRENNSSVMRHCMLVMLPYSYIQSQQVHLLMSLSWTLRPRALLWCGNWWIK